MSSQLPVGSRTRCPSCGFEQAEAAECGRCGIVFKKKRDESAPRVHRPAVPAGATDFSVPLDLRFRSSRYRARKAIFSFTNALEIFDDAGETVFYVAQKFLSIKDDIRVYTDSSQSRTALTIRARGFIEDWACFDVTDLASGRGIGSLKRKWLHSIVRDEWQIQDEVDDPIGAIREDNLMLATLRRTPIGQFIPQTFVGTVQEHTVFEFKQDFNPFVQWLTLDFSMDGVHLLDRRMGIAAAVLLLVIEGRQDDD